MLYDPARHEPVQTIPWDEARVRAAIRAIVEDAEGRFSPEHYWPPHPKDSDADRRALTPLYFGAIGVIWALHYLREKRIMVKTTTNKTATHSQNAVRNSVNKLVASLQ